MIGRFFWLAVTRSSFSRLSQRCRVFSTSLSMSTLAASTPWDKQLTQNIIAMEVARVSSWTRPGRKTRSLQGNVPDAVEVITSFVEIIHSKLTFYIGSSPVSSSASQWHLRPASIDLRWIRRLLLGLLFGLLSRATRSLLCANLWTLLGILTVLGLSGRATFFLLYADLWDHYLHSACTWACKPCRSFLII